MPHHSMRLLQAGFIMFNPDCLVMEKLLCILMYGFIRSKKLQGFYNKINLADFFFCVFKLGKHNFSIFSLHFQGSNKGGPQITWLTVGNIIDEVLSKLLEVLVQKHQSEGKLHSND